MVSFYGPPAHHSLSLLDDLKSGPSSCKIFLCLIQFTKWPLSLSWTILAYYKLQNSPSAYERLGLPHSIYKMAQMNFEIQMKVAGSNLEQQSCNFKKIVYLL